MRRIIMAAVVPIILAGCAANPPQTTAYDVWRQDWQEKAQRQHQLDQELAALDQRIHAHCLENNPGHPEQCDGKHGTAAFTTAATPLASSDLSQRMDMLELQQSNARSTAANAAFSQQVEMDALQEQMRIDRQYPDAR